jgi:hypothetical protein
MCQSLTMKRHVNSLFNRTTFASITTAEVCVDHNESPYK